MRRQVAGVVLQLTNSQSGSAAEFPGAALGELVHREQPLWATIPWRDLHTALFSGFNSVRGGLKRVTIAFWTSLAHERIETSDG